MEGVPYAVSPVAKEQDLQDLQHRTVIPTSTVVENRLSDEISQKGGSSQFLMFVRCIARR